MLNKPHKFYDDLPPGFDGLWNFDVLKGCFPRGITPMDLDGTVEINGRFLVFETKKPGVKLPHGQRRALEALVKLGFFTVVYVAGKPGVADAGIEDGFEYFEVWNLYLGDVYKKYYENVGVEELRAFCARWSESVERLAPPIHRSTLLEVYNHHRIINEELSRLRQAETESA